MRRQTALLAVLALALCVPFGTLAAPQDDVEYSNIRIVRLSLVEGDAQVFRPEQGEWEEARQNLPIQKAYAVATGRGRVEIEFESGGTARLDEFTELEFTELALVNGARVTTLRLERGSAIFYANGDKHDLFEVITGRQRIRAERNARFRVDAGEDELVVAVLKGEVDVEFAGDSQRVKKNQELRLSAGAVEVVRHGDGDEFERWALDREEVLSASYNSSSQYVNAPFRYGVGDLSNYGSWYYTSAYGYVWQPYGVGFTPYVNGTWIWVNGFGLSWVGYEPWGWLPYHYGRWVWTGFGWAWVPGSYRHWNPAHVTWVRFNDGRLGWCPRSPHDRQGHRPRNLGVGTVVWNGRNPAVRSVGTNDNLEVLSDRPTRERLADELGFSGRNPLTNRAGRGPRDRTPEASGTVAGPRSGFSGSTGLDVRQRPSVEETGRVPVSRGDVRFDREQGKFVNTPVREREEQADTPRSGWGGATGGRPRPNFPRAEEGSAPDVNGNRNGARGSTSNDQLRYGTVPRGSDSRSAGFSGRVPSADQQPRSSAPPRNDAPRSTPAQQPRSSPPRQSNPPPRSSPPPQQQQQRQPSYQPPRQSPPPSPPRTSPPPRPSSPPPQVRQSPPPRQAPKAQARQSSPPRVWVRQAPRPAPSQQRKASTQRSRSTTKRPNLL